jgi:hypothetical protein
MIKGKHAKIDFRVVWQAPGRALQALEALPGHDAGRLLDGHHPRRRHPASFMRYGVARRSEVRASA